MTAGQDLAVERVDDVAHADEEVPLGRMPGALDQGASVDQRHHMARPDLDHGLVQARTRNKREG